MSRNALVLKNPHSILAAIEKRPRDVQRVVAPSHPTEEWVRVLELCRHHLIPIQQPVDREEKRKEKQSEGRQSAHEALVLEREPVGLDSLFSAAKSTAQFEDGQYGVWLALDTLQDPQNVGAIFRTAAFFGIQGVVLTSERSSPMTHTLYDVASGGVEWISFSVQTNLVRTLELAKQAGLWVLGTSETAADPLQSLKRDRHWLIVIGNEEKGMRRLTMEHCDQTCRIPGSGHLKSLNASVAAAIMMSYFSVVA